MRATWWGNAVGAGKAEIERTSMLRRLNEGPPPAEALDRIEEWTRGRFALTQDTAVLVSEVACGLPGCPPRETVVVFWTESDKRHKFRIFKPPEEVAENDLPPAWLKNALIALDGFECC
jgi:nitrate reductase delta subunit